MLLGGGLEKDGQHHMVSKTRGIITLYRHQKAAFAITSKRGPTPKAPKTPATELPPGSTISPDNDEVQRITEVRLPHISYCVFTLYVLFLLEEKAISYSKERGRILLNNYCQALWSRSH